MPLLASVEDLFFFFFQTSISLCLLTLSTLLCIKYYPHTSETVEPGPLISRLFSGPSPAGEPRSLQLYLSRCSCSGPKLNSSLYFNCLRNCELAQLRGWKRTDMLKTTHTLITAACIQTAYVGSSSKRTHVNSSELSKQELQNICCLSTGIKFSSFKF